MAGKSADLRFRASLRSPPLVDMRDMYPWAGDRTDVEKSFQENDFEPLGGLNVPSKKPPKRKQIADAGTTMSDAPPVAMKADANGNLVPYTPEPFVPLPKKVKNTKPLGQPDAIDNAFLALTKLYDNLGLTNSTEKLFVDKVARGNRDPITEKDLGPDDIKNLRKLVDTKRAAKPGPQGTIGPQDYLDAGQDNVSLLGLFDYDVDDEGNIIARDTYDYNLSDVGKNTHDVTAMQRLGAMISNPTGYANYVGTKAIPDLPGKGVPVNINLGNTMEPQMNMGTDATFGAPPMASQSNAGIKVNQGEQPGNVALMLNSLLNMLTGTGYGRNPAATSNVSPEFAAPPIGQQLGGGMEMRAPMAPPMPTPNPLFHAAPGGVEQQIAETMSMPHAMSVAAPPIPAPLASFETPLAPDLNPPTPTKKTPPPSKPERPADKGKREAKKETTGAKRVASPPLPKRKSRA